MLQNIQIRFILLQNRQGKTRLSRWYVSHNDDERRKIETETHRTIVSRDNKMTSFLEVSGLLVNTYFLLEMQTRLTKMFFVRVRSIGTIKLFTAAMLGCSSLCASTPRTASYLCLNSSTCSWRCWISTLGVYASWTSSSTSTKSTRSLTRWWLAAKSWRLAN